MEPSIPHPHPTAVLLFFYLVLIAAAAYAGGAWVAWLQLGHRPMQVILSFTGGILLGVGMLHLLPHAVLELQGDVDTAATWALGGFFLMFLLERAFHAHAHHAADSTGCDHPDHEHHHGHDHGHAAEHGHNHAVPSGRWAWCGAFAGLTLHSLADGAALAASTNADATHGVGGWAGFATFLAILLHKPLDSGIIAALLNAAGAQPRTRLLANLAYALIVPLGAVGFLFSLRLIGGDTAPFLGHALALAAGAFICIAAADLLPEVQFHSHDRVLLTAALTLGLAVAWGISAIERTTHDHGPRPAAAHGDHAH